MIKNKLFSLVYFSIIFLILVYLIYNDFYLSQREFSQFYNIYYIILGISFLFTLITLFLKKKTNQNIFLIFFSIMISLYAVEIFLNFSPIQKKIIISKKNLQVENHFNKKDLNFIGSNYFYTNNKNKKYFPLSGIANLKTVYCNENGYFANYMSDRYGFNNPDKVWDYSELDFVLLGDSFTQGACVNYNDTFAGNLSQKDQKVLSLGNNGNGPLRSYASYKEYIRDINVKKIIWFYYEGNDLEDLKTNLKHEILSRYFLEKNFSQDLIKNSSEIENLKIDFLNTFHQKNFDKSPRGGYEKNILEFITVNNKKDKQQEKINEIKKFKSNDSLSYLLGTIKLRKIRSMLPKVSYNFFKIPDSKNLKSFTQILYRTKRLANENNSKLYFVYLPSKNRYTGHDYNLFEKSLIKRNIKKLNIQFIDIDKSLFSKIANPESYYANHLNEKGYEFVMRKVLQMINNK